MRSARVWSPAAWASIISGIFGPATWLTTEMTPVPPSAHHRQRHLVVAREDLEALGGALDDLARSGGGSRWLP